MVRGCEKVENHCPSSSIYLLSKSVCLGEEPHNSEKYIDRHPLHHLPLEHRDPKYIDPKKDADFENMHKHDHEHTVEL